MGEIMVFLTPGQVALWIVASVVALGVILALVRSRMTFYGYHDIAAEVGRLSQAMRGPVVRNGSDLVVAGTCQGAQAVVRFSKANGVLRLNVRMPAATTFQLSVAHTSAPAGEAGHTVLKTGNEEFDAKFATRTNRPTHAKIFLHPSITALLQKLAGSNDALLSIGGGAIELSQRLVASPNTSERIVEHLQTMAELGVALRAMPGADLVKLETFPVERHIAGRVAIAVGVVIALGCIYAAMQAPSQAAFQDVNATVANGIPPADAMLLHDARRWRVASPDDFDPIAAAWLRGQGRAPAGRIAADFTGKGTAGDVGYLLIGPAGRRRIAILGNHATGLDGEMVDIAGIAAVPKSAVAKISWKGGKAPDNILGDGLLVVQRHGDAYTSVVFFLSQSGVVSGAPEDYQQISLP